MIDLKELQTNKLQKEQQRLFTEFQIKQQTAKSKIRLLYQQQLE